MLLKNRWNIFQYTKYSIFAFDKNDFFLRIGIISASLKSYGKVLGKRNLL